MKSNRRDETIDIMKGLLILSVVVCHAQVNQNIHRFIYIFHMPVFFMISGYLWNDLHDYPFRKVLLKRLKSLYLPYVMCNLLYLVLFLICPIIFDAPMAEKSKKGILTEVLKILLFKGRCSMSDVTWFIAALFVTTMLYFWIYRFVSKICVDTRPDIKNLLVFFLCFAAIAFGAIISKKGYNIWQLGMIGSTVFSLNLGHMIKVTEEYSSCHLKGSALFLVSLSGLLVLFSITKSEVRLINNEIINPVYYFLASIFGWKFVEQLANFSRNSRVAKVCFENLGKYSLSIMCFHFLAFKLAAMIQCAFNGKSISLISNFPVAMNSNEGWVLYTAIGVTVPLIIGIVWDQIKGRIFVYARK